MNKKIIKATGCFMLSAAMLFSAAACKKDLGGDWQGDGNEVFTPSYTENYSGGTHIVNVSITQKNFVKDGKTEYKIVLEENNSALLGRAATELTTFLYEASGVESIPVLSDARAEYTAQSKYIVIGDNSVTKAAGLSLNAEEADLLGNDGYRIVTKDESVFIFGNTDTASLYGLYDFMYYTLGVEFFGGDNYSIIKNENVFLPDFNITEVPDFETRIGGIGMKGENTNERLRFNNDGLITVQGNGWHTSMLFLPKETYYEAHPDWYASNLPELCFTAHGVEEEYEAMANEMYIKVRDLLIDYPDANRVAIGQMDGAGGKWCNCATCTAEKQKYGTDSAVLVKFINDVSSRVTEYFKEQGDEREITYTFLAYNYVTDLGPAKKNEDGTWSAIDVRCNDNVVPTLAHLDKMHNRPYTDKQNEHYRDSIASWAAVSDRMYNWLYQTNFYHYMFPYETFSSYQDDFKYILERGSEFIFVQGQFNVSGHTGFNDLKNYICSKLMWNVNENLSELYDRYFKGVFREAAQPMKEYFYSLTAHMKENDEMYEEESYGYAYYNLQQSKLWSKGALDNWLKKTDEAYAAVEHYKTEDPVLYSKISDSICSETIFPRYALLVLYSSSYVVSDLQDMRRSFKDDTQRLEIFRLSEASLFDEVFASWGV